MKKRGFTMPDFTNGFKAILAVIVFAVVGTGLYFWAPGLNLAESLTLSGLTMDDTKVDNVDETEMLPLPKTTLSNLVSSNPQVRMAGYAWSAQMGLLTAIGGANTTQGSLMEQNGVNINFVRKDGVNELKEMQTLFITEFDKGVAYPKNELSAFGVVLMGDGAPYYISTMQKSLDDKFGKDKYHLEVAGAVGISYGEDKLIGPPEWKTNPSSMIGKVISVVIGDGDWVTTLNYCFANGLKVNPNIEAYDEDAVNFYASADDNYINSAKELIKSQTTGWKVPFAEIKNGQLTGKTVEKLIDGCATWSPADDRVFKALNGFTDIVSTKDFNNQMATTIIVVKEWAEQPANAKIVSNILKSTYAASNQIKQYDSWKRTGSEIAAKVYNSEDGNFWYNIFQGQVGEKNGIPFSVGGSRVFTYADAMQYYGLTDGVNRYKAVYEQVSGYCIQLNPFDFNSQVDGVTPYDKAVNLYYLKNINDVEAGTAYKADYTETKTEKLASGQWEVNFAHNSATILATSNKTLDNLYNLLIQAEDAKLVVEGHTDNSGSDATNLAMSQSRAESVYQNLIARGIPENRFVNSGTRQVVGKGETEPIADNGTAEGQRVNRRVVIQLLK